MPEHTQAVEPAKASGWSETEEKRIAEIQESTGCDRKEAVRQMRRDLIASKAGGGRTTQAKKEKTVKTKKERKPRTKGGKTQQQAAWKDYYDNNKAKYRAWARGWRSGGKLTFQEFNKKWEKEHAK